MALSIVDMCVPLQDFERFPSSGARPAELERGKRDAAHGEPRPERLAGRRTHQRFSAIFENVSEMTTHLPSFLTATQVNLVVPSVEITSAVFP